MNNTINDVLNYHEKQTILYCKGWFEVDDFVDDIKVIMASYYDSHVTSYHKYDVYNYLLEIIFKLDNYIVDGGVKGFFKRIFKYETNIDVTYLIERLVSEISLIKSIDLNLGKPDYSILPEK